MKYEDIVEALKEELGLCRILGVTICPPAFCQACGRSEDVLHIRGCMPSNDIRPSNYEDLYLCADRHTCRLRDNGPECEETEALESLFVPL